MGKLKISFVKIKLISSQETGRLKACLFLFF